MRNLLSSTTKTKAAAVSCKLGLLFIFCITLLSACRFTVPSSGDGQHLLERGVFGEKVPAWVNQTKTETMHGTDSGIVPSSYSVPSAIKTSRNVASTGIEQSKDTREEMEAAEDSTSDASSLAQNVDSPIDRIESECPGLESSVSDALRTESRSARIRKYESLTTRCPGSADLWFWLAKDYHESNQLVQAARSFERTLILDPQNEAAKALQSVVKQKLNQSGSATQ